MDVDDEDVGMDAMSEDSEDDGEDTDEVKALKVCCCSLEEEEGE